MEEDLASALVRGEVEKCLVFPEFHLVAIRRPAEQYSRCIFQGIKRILHPLHFVLTTLSWTYYSVYAERA